MEVDATIASTGRVAVIIASYNGRQWSERCFTSLRNSLHPITSVLVDNASTDDTIDFIAHAFPEVHIIANKRNEGFGRANNQGIERALQQGAEYCLLLNQDAWVEPETIGKLLEAAAAHPEYAIVSPMHFTGSGEKLDHNFEFYLRKDYPKDKIISWTSNYSAGVHPSQFINAAAWFIPRECFEWVGGFGDLFFHYGEDYDFVHRVEFCGRKIGFTANARIFHDRESRIVNPLKSRPALTRYYFIGSLVRSADIRYKFSVALARAIWWDFKELVVLFLRGRWWAPVVFFDLVFKLTGKKRQIRKYRDLISGNEKYKFLQHLPVSAGK